MHPPNITIILVSTYVHTAVSFSHPMVIIIHIIMLLLLLLLLRRGCNA